MPILSAKKAEKKYKPKNTSKTAEQRKNEELYGRSMVEVRPGIKNEGGNLASKKPASSSNTKDKKY